MIVFILFCYFISFFLAGWALFSFFFLSWSSTFSEGHIQRNFLTIQPLRPGAPSFFMRIHRNDVWFVVLLTKCYVHGLFFSTFCEKSIRQCWRQATIQYLLFSDSIKIWLGCLLLVFVVSSAFLLLMLALLNQVSESNILNVIAFGLLHCFESKSLRPDDGDFFFSSRFSSPFFLFFCFVNIALLLSSRPA